MPVVQQRAVTGPALVRLDGLRFFNHVFANCGIPLVVSGPSGTISHANAAVEELLGWGPGELLGHDLAELAEPGSSPFTLEQVRAAGGVWTGEQRVRRKSGAVTSVRVTVSIVTNEYGEPLGLVSALSDNSGELRQRARLVSLVRLGAALNAGKDLQLLLSRICQEARALFAVEAVFLSRLDERAGDLVFYPVDPKNSPDESGNRVAIDSSDSVTAEAARERRTVIRNHVEAAGVNADYLARNSVRSVMAVPLLRGERLLGVLTIIDRRYPARFTSEDAELARSFCDIAAAALENARLHEAERAKAERLVTLIHVNQLLTASLESDQVFEAIAQGAHRLLAVDQVRVWLLQSAQGPFRLEHVSTPCEQPLIGAEFDLRGTRLGEAVISGQPFQSSNLKDELRWKRLQYAAHEQFSSCLLIPLVAQGCPLGGLTMFSRQPRTWDKEEVEMAMAFGNQAALAVHNAQTLARERRASKLKRLVQGAQGLEPQDKDYVEQLLATAERLILLSTRQSPI